MALDFPNAPTNGQSFTAPNGVIWTWDGVKWVNGTGVATYAPIVSPPFTGDPTAPTPAYGDNDTSIATTAFVQAAVAPMTHNVGRNLLHNSLFNVAQRGGGPWNTAGAYTADRWVMFVGGGDALSIGLYTSSGLSGDEGVQKFIGIYVTGSASAGSYSNFAQRTEDVTRLGNKTVTVSFGANCGTGAPKLGVAVSQLFGSGGSPSPSVDTPVQTVTLSPTAARYSLTFNIPSIAGKTLGTNGDHCTQLSFILSSSAAPMVAQTANINIWGVQLEVGSVATPLEKPDPQQDLAKCQRFYQIGRSAIGGYQVAGGYISYATTLHQRMRSTPTVVFTDTGSGNVAAPFVNEAGIASVWIAAVATATGGVSIIGNFTASADL